MEKRVVLAVVLSFLVLVLYQMVFLKKKPQTEVPPQTPAVVEKALAPQAQELEKETGLQAAKPEETGPAPRLVQAGKEEEVSLETSLYRAVWSNRGAVLKSWKLKKYKDDNIEDLELVSLNSQTLNAYPLSLMTDDVALNDILNNSLYLVASSPSPELGDGEQSTLRFEFSDGQTTKVEKSFTFFGGQYELNVDVHVWKNGQEVRAACLWGPGFGNPSAAEQKQRFGGGGGIAVLASGKVYRQNERKYKAEESAFNFVNWAAYEDNYFSALFLTEPQKGTALFLREMRDQIPHYFLSVNNVQRAFLGPKDFDILKTLGSETTKVINFGFFGAIAEILLRAMKFIHRLIPNWGVAIILITVVIKIIFFPLTYSSTKSMSKMQELQPKIKALRAKYKKAKQDISQRRQMNEEMMKLYKEHGVNPAGGCLPLLIQIPVFWGFFRLLTVAIEFRKAPFFLWIRDLSVKDPYYVTPILMGITQFISQKMTPTSADPAQARMMLIMPVVMTVFFMNFQSGLVLYWLMNNVLQIGQQALMNHLMKKKKSETHGKRR